MNNYLLPRRQPKKFHAILIDECGEEFATATEALTWVSAHQKLMEEYPESRIASLREG